MSGQKAGRKAKKKDVRSEHCDDAAGTATEDLPEEEVFAAEQPVTEVTWETKAKYKRAPLTTSPPRLAAPSPIPWD